MRGFKFEAILVLEFKKIENDDETKFTTFYFNAKAQTIINECVILMTYLNQFILRLYRTYKNILEKVLIRLLIKL